MGIVAIACRPKFLIGNMSANFWLLSMKKQLHTSLPTQVPSQILAQGSLVEPLSERECEVLKLIAAGYTNQQIADALVVSLNTVKKHTTHIYGKLGVKNRAQAIAKGREIELIQ